MRNLIIILVTVLLASSCSMLDLSPGISIEGEIRSDSDFQSLVDFGRTVMAGEASELEALDVLILPLIESLDAKFISHHSLADQEVFRRVFNEEVIGSSDARLPIREFNTSHNVYAPIDEVWFTLEDVASFPEWNPFTPIVETTFEIGSPIIMHVRMFRQLPDIILVQPETVLVFDINDQMCWESVFGSEFWLSSYRCYVVDQVGSEETILQSTMKYEGLLAPLANAFTYDLVTNGFNDVANAMKNRLE